MRTEFKQELIHCDGCGRPQESQIAIAGYHDSGWKIKGDLDICSVCYGLIALDAFNKMSYEEVKEQLNDKLNYIPAMDNMILC